MNTVPSTAEVRVSPIECRRFLITCSSCPNHHVLRNDRPAANRHAAAHHRSHSSHPAQNTTTDHIEEAA